MKHFILVLVWLFVGVFSTYAVGLKTRTTGFEFLIGSVSGPIMLPFAVYMYTKDCFMSCTGTTK